MESTEAILVGTISGSGRCGGVKARGIRGSNTASRWLRSCEAEIISYLLSLYIRH
jgi:hypothetical protein